MKSRIATKSLNHRLRTVQLFSAPSPRNALHRARRTPAQTPPQPGSLPTIRSRVAWPPSTGLAPLPARPGPLAASERPGDRAPPACPPARRRGAVRSASPVGLPPRCWPLRVRGLPPRAAGGAAAAAPEPTRAGRAQSRPRATATERRGRPGTAARPDGAPSDGAGHGGGRARDGAARRGTEGTGAGGRERGTQRRGGRGGGEGRGREREGEGGGWEGGRGGGVVGCTPGLPAGFRPRSPPGRPRHPHPACNPS